MKCLSIRSSPCLRKKGRRIESAWSGGEGGEDSAKLGISLQTASAAPLSFKCRGKLPHKKCWERRRSLAATHFAKGKEEGRRSERTNAVKERNNGGRICRHKPNLQNPDTSGGLTEIHLRSKLRESAHVSSLFD